MSLDQAARRALFEAVGKGLPEVAPGRNRRTVSTSSGHDVQPPQSAVVAADPDPRREAPGAGGLVNIKQVKEKAPFHRGNLARPVALSGGPEKLNSNNFGAVIPLSDERPSSFVPAEVPSEAYIAFTAHQLRGRWLSDDRYRGMRNAAWAVRNSRHGQMNNPVALEIVRTEAVSLIAAGEPLSDIIEALAELLVHP